MLHMIQLNPELAAFTTWAAQQDVLKTDDDQGYAMHALLAACFGEKAPKPFRFFSPVRNRLKILGYAAASAAELQDHARTFAEPSALSAAGVDTLQSKAMPARWRAGTQLGFELRARPIRRVHRSDRTIREIDAFLHVASARPGEPISREKIYGDWIKEQIERSGAAKVLQLQLLGYRRSSVVRRGKGRAFKSAEGPDVLARGVLEIQADEAFVRLLARGVGRHRSFGFGMLLLRPA